MDSEKTCSQTDCYPEDVGCQLGDQPERCKHFAGNSATANTDSVVKFTESARGRVLPWSGSAFGATDLQFLAARAKPMIVAIVGPHNAGKTTLLSLWYFLLGRRPTLADGRLGFAGSYTLQGWEQIASPLRWTASAGYRFPSHTPATADRVPGLLHLSFRDDAGRLKDFLFADTPGEWFQHWAVDRDAADAAGAAWLGQRADAFILVADSEALAGPLRGLAKQEFKLLASRLATERPGAPVALVWTKADIAVPHAVTRDLMDAMARYFTDFDEFSVGVKPGDTIPRDEIAARFTSVIDWVVKYREPRGFLQTTQAVDSDDLFFVLGK